MNKLIGLFAKEPKPGFVKTRLASATSADWAAAVASAFLSDLVEKLHAIDARRVVAYTPTTALPFFQRTATDGFEFVDQGDGDLGRRMQRFCKSALSAGNEAVVLVGMDSPTLPTNLIEQAFDALESSDVVIGPATDGGYYLLGIAGKVPPIFDNVDWGSANVLHQTMAHLADLPYRVQVLQPWYDVDTLDDVYALYGHMTACRRAGIDLRIPKTEELLKEGIPTM